MGWFDNLKRGRNEQQKGSQTTPVPEEDVVRADEVSEEESSVQESDASLIENDFYDYMNCSIVVRVLLVNIL